MALKFGKSKGTVKSKSKKVDDDEPIKKKKKKTKKAGEGSVLTSKKASKKSKKVTKPNFVKTGKTAKKLIKKEKELAEQRDAMREAGKDKDGNKILRFYLKKGDERRITFLDGGLDADGDVMDNCYYEHTVNNKSLWFPKFVCTAGYEEDGEDGSCPLCDEDNTPYFATAFTVLDHTEWTDKEGGEHDGSVMLFIAKPGVAEQLRKKAKKYGGLVGATFDVSRVGKMSASVGDDFDYLETNKLKRIQKSFPDLNIKAFDYGEVLPYVPASTLREMGYGDSTTVVDDKDSELDEDDDIPF